VSSINSIFAQTPYTPAGAPNTRMTPFEVTSKEFGPVAASAAEATAVVTDAASAGYSFSTESLKRLADLASTAVHDVSTAWSASLKTVGDAVDGVENIVHEASSDLSSLENGVKNTAIRAYQTVEDSAASAVSSVDDAITAVQDFVSPVTSTLENMASAVTDGVNGAANSLTSYLSLGAAVLK
jgi:phage-related protein